jgi:cellulose synthase/poly-beta-1,6-N-acetylglucosamine synthase-like glycosyltransferase
MIREDDSGTWSLLSNFGWDPLRLQTVEVARPGQVAALNAGLEVFEGGILAITDDDAAPHPDWLARIEAHFGSTPEVGGVGGRDRVYHGRQLEDGSRNVVGKVQWFGRVIGNHHLGVGEPRYVDVLKGANCAYRRDAIRHVGFDERLLGTGAQVHNDLSVSLRLRREGWRLIYDPAVAVDHYPATRFDEDQRQSFSAEATFNEVHNETLLLLEHLPSVRRLVFILWAVIVGTRAAPGLVQWLRFLPREGRLSGERLQTALKGRAEGWKTWRRCNA